MKNDTIGYWLLFSIFIHLFGVLMVMLGGTGAKYPIVYLILGFAILLFSVLAIIRLLQLNNKDWIPWALIISLILALVSLSFSGVFQMPLYLFGIWAGLKLTNYFKEI